VVALRIPKVGELSRKEREDNHPLFDQKKGAKFIDDFKRLQKSFPERPRRCASWPARPTRISSSCVAGDPAHHIKASDTKFPGRLSEREINVYAAAGQLPRRAGEEVCRSKHGRFVSPMRW
jgi:aspartyl-tRNA synthetase